MPEERIDLPVIEHLAEFNPAFQTIMRFIVLSRDLYTCECGAGATEVHHIISRRHRGAWQAKNLISLCAKCHRLADKGAGAHSHEAKKRHLRLLRDKFGYEYKDRLWLSALEEAA